MNIVLCGMMGVGKSTVGMKIAELTGRRWVDTDVIITTRHGRISDIFEYYGEEHNELLKEKGKIFFLRASFETLLKRVRADETRPLLKDTGRTAERLKELLEQRTPVYEHAADYIIDTDLKSVEEAAAEIVALSIGGAR